MFWTYAGSDEERLPDVYQTVTRSIRRSTVRHHKDIRCRLQYDSIMHRSILEVGVYYEMNQKRKFVLCSTWQVPLRMPAYAVVKVEPFDSSGEEGCRGCEDFAKQVLGWAKTSKEFSETQAVQCLKCWLRLHSIGLSMRGRLVVDRNLVNDSLLISPLEYCWYEFAVP